MDEEIWKPIIGWEGLYEVSDHGRVRSLDRTVKTSKGHIRKVKGRVLRPHGRTKSLPYDIVTLTRGGRRGAPGMIEEMPYVHTLVLEHFVCPRPEGMEACHNDGNGMNNHIDNLRWDTHKNNMQDQLRHGTHVSMIGK